MKKTIFMLAVIAVFSFTSCKNSNKKSADKNAETTTEQVAKDGASTSATQQYPELTFAEASFDFGQMTEGDVVSHTFAFTNTGEAPLKVMQANPSCGCTVPTFSEHPIAPGEQGEIVVKFNSTGKHGVQHKSVRLTTNTKKGNEVLRFTAQVKKK